MGMNPPSVLLDLTFLIAVADTDDAHHDEAVAIYQSLIDDFLAQRHLLFARNDHLAAVGKTDLFAAVDKMYVARQHRNAAEELRRSTPVDPDLAITLVLIHRMKVRRVATFDDRLADYELDRVGLDRVTAQPAEPTSELDPGSA
jgi:predicted nucleic acid-binding protein